MEWITAKEAAEVWGLSTCRIQYLCVNGRIDDEKKQATI
jgi:hypothetical protein